MRQRIEHIPFGKLDLAQRFDSEGPAALLLRNHGVIDEGDLSIEAAGEHPLVGAHQLRLYPNVPQAQAGKRREVGVAPGIEPGGDDIDDLHPSLFTCAGLEELLLACLHRPILELPLDDLEAFVDLTRIAARAVAPQEKLDHVRGHRELAAEGPHEVLAYQVAFEHADRLPVDAVRFGHCPPPATIVGA